MDDSAYGDRLECHVDQVNSLDQIKWIFEPAKNPTGKNGSSFRDAMMQQIDELPVTDNMARKLLGDPDMKSADLIEQIGDSFGDIFIK
ncbi:hypothetical protein [Rubritalea marina]|uniref:hypothetical protein n=1 Tax=Rubritalea marina TaxID=361055 RepID=UPI0012E9B859|nr:hypothetical protein [Rubritalea marina]